MKMDTKKLRELIKARGLTNTGLATQAGITRQALQVMLRDGGVVEARPNTVQGLVNALRLPDASALSPDPLSGYKQAVADEYADLNFHGLGLSTTEPRLIDELFVPVRLKLAPAQKQENECKPSTVESRTTHPEGDDREVKEPETLSFEDCIRRYRRVLIRGEPGSGKTTSLRHAAWKLALGTFEPNSQEKLPKIPLLVRLADFSKAREGNNKPTIVQFVVGRILRDAPVEQSSLVEQNLIVQLTKGNCLVLFDGLDELGGGNDILPVLRQFIRQFGENHFLLTSRSIGLDSSPWRNLNFASLEIDRWQDQEIKDFAIRWYAGHSPPGKKQSKREIDQLAEKLSSTVLSHAPLREIGSNPLMLTILAALHHADATLPRRRVDLYGKIVEVMLETWERSKREARPGDPLHGIDLGSREFGWLLGRVGVSMQREGRILRPRWWVTDIVQEFLRNTLALDGDAVKEQAERVIRYLCERAGLLVERGEGIFGFGHRTFQEYFAAQGLLLEAESGIDLVASLGLYVFAPRWEEVVVHLAASASPARATALMRVILDDPDPAGRFLRRGQKLAMRCLADGAAVADRGLLAQIFSGGEEIGESRWLGTSIRVFKLLEEIKATRHQAEARGMQVAVEKGAMSLPEDDYLTFYCSTHEPPNEPGDASPGESIEQQIGKYKIRMVWTGRDKLRSDADKWISEISVLLHDRKVSSNRKAVLVSVFGDLADFSERVRSELGRLLTSNQDARIRVACARALEPSLMFDKALAKLLLIRMEKDKSPEVRGACAAALRGIAPNRADVREKLREVFLSGTQDVRSGAARGLSLLDFSLPEVLPLFREILGVIASTTEPVKVRCAGICTLAGSLGQDGMEEADRVVEESLGDKNEGVRRAALHVISDAIAEGRKKYSRSFLEKIEAMLMSITDPCSHLYSNLVAIVALKESSDGHRLERLLRNALDSFKDRIKLAFVFGSVARMEQDQDSDIDLMIVGDVRLKEISLSLQSPERTLGKTVNPILFAPEKFREQYREGNPFLLDVVRKEKIFLKGNRDELTELVGE